jgi:type II secretory pathway pseudopilin PulG
MSQRAHINDARNEAFSLVEVVLALGVISFAIVAIFGLLPIGLNTGRAAQDQTRADQLAETLIDSMASQAQTQFSAVTLPSASPAPPPLDLATSISTAAAPAVQLYANNDGQLSTVSAGAVYSVKILTNNVPTGFDPGYANEVTISVAWPAVAATTAQTVQSFSRVITKY